MQISDFLVKKNVELRNPKSSSVDVFSFLNMLQKFVDFLLLHFIIPSYFEGLHCDIKQLKSTSQFDIHGFIDLKEFIVDSIKYLGQESNFSIRPPRDFKILSTKFQWTQTIERYLVERSAYAMILGNNTKFLVNYLYVAGSNLGHQEGDFIITSLLDNYYQFDLQVT